jgi:hypothetical protein
MLFELPKNLVVHLHRGTGCPLEAVSFRWTFVGGYHSARERRGDHETRGGVERVGDGHVGNPFLLKPHSSRAAAPRDRAEWGRQGVACNRRG